jgi:pimeloyl-ACP methyl ester carboxylesterase
MPWIECDASDPTAVGDAVMTEPCAAVVVTERSASGDSRDVRVESRFVVVDGIRTHFLEAGAGPTVVLLHAGDFGSCSEMSWEYTIGPLARHYHVIAPDWLGFGLTDKLHDFAGGQRRRLWHMGRVLETLAIERAAFIGNSMGGTLLAGVAASARPAWPIAALVLASAGGFVPDSQARRDIMNFDGTADGMRRILRTVMYDERWSRDEAYVARRLRFATAPGAYEAIAAARFKSPLVPPRSEFGQPDTIPYEEIAVPTLLIAGANDRLRLPGYLREPAARIPDNRVLVFEECGHMPQLEQAEAFNDAVLEFLTDVYPAEPEL